MRRDRFVCGICAAVLWVGRAGLAFGEDAPKVSAPLPRPISKETKKTDESEREQILMHLMIFEIEGDPDLALRLGHFRQTGPGKRFVAEGEGHKFGGLDGVSAWLKDLQAEHVRVELLSRPLVRTVIDQTAHLQIGATGPGLPYLVRTGPKSFELRETADGTNLGLKFELTPRPVADNSDQIEISPFKISTTTLDGREELPGLDLAVGKPIVSTRSLETSMTFVDGAAASGIALPSPPGRNLYLFMTVRRARTKVAEPAPKAPAKSPREEFPNPPLIDIPESKK